MPAPPKLAEGLDLKKKVGSLPVWAWSLLGIGGAWLGIRWYRAKKAAAASVSTTTAVPASSAPLPYNGLGAGIGGGYGGGGGGSPWPATPSPSPPPVSTLGPQVTPVAPTLSAPAPVVVPQVPAGIQPSYLQGLGFSPDQISGVLQPQDQPSVNPYVSPAPTQALPVGAQLGPATGVGQRYLTPGPNPFPFTYG